MKSKLGPGLDVWPILQTILLWAGEIERSQDDVAPDLPDRMRRYVEWWLGGDPPT